MASSDQQERWRPGRAAPISRPQWSVSLSVPPRLTRFASTMPLGSVGFENQRDANGDWLIWLPRDVLAKLKALRGPGEDYSAAILRVAEATAGR
jgi:hypothetical protein